MGRFAHSKGMFRRPTKADRQIVELALERLKLRIYAIVRLISFQVGSVSGLSSQSPGTGRELYLMDEPLAGLIRQQKS